MMLTSSSFLDVTEYAEEASEDDPALYEAEVRSREKEFGPHHPDVAESLGNLAILYNQRQEYDKAQPLLERALHIYEQTRGPDHPDVAHILTDLAVLHLEQVHTMIWRSSQSSLAY